MMTKLIRYLMVLTIVVASSSSSQPLPHYDGKIHEGVASCASSTCHGSVVPRSATNVLQNEYVTWSRHDAHAQAYKTLLSEESKRIARNLGLPNAHEAKICLDCHADNVPTEFHGARFVMDDGIGCEACHGGAEDYIKSHTVAGTSREDNIKNGLYPTDDPTARAKLCLSCHLGDHNKFATHEIMGAGHPRLSFELDTFTILQPLHYVVDEDYQRRKWSGDSLQTWLMGQLQASVSTLELIETRLYIDGQLFPEIALFDCHSCHHPMSELRWSEAKGNGQMPGAMRLNDGNFKMLLAITNDTFPEIAKGIENEIRALKLSVHNKAKVQSTIERVRALLNEMSRQVGNWATVQEDTAERILRGVFQLSKRGELQDYIAAEQAVMAIDILLVRLSKREQLDTQLSSIYEALDNEDEFDPRVLQSRVQSLENAL